ncbi:hypothetical protein BIFANG_02851 [Bifidobacterium angulatum DSM 20098 = JCM 7096]|uniref:Uncharacterized protein n=1 Tax=Bifidobacterium angulatum DSM 20098 = JCM 7096 TaxID=518635 RepID=C4FEV5_9BIFI|nr:hypothetical protein BIFANG_02851 [Bifidobacterium angulatum DSM 20098 = JCM 7096]
MSNEYTARLSMHKTHGKTCCAALGQRRDGTNRRLFEDGTAKRPPHSAEQNTPERSNKRHPGSKMACMATATGPGCRFR